MLLVLIIRWVMCLDMPLHVHNLLKKNCTMAFFFLQTVFPLDVPL